MMPVNPEAIGIFGLIATVVCFGLEQIGVGVDENTYHSKLTRNIGSYCNYFWWHNAKFFLHQFLCICSVLPAVTALIWEQCSAFLGCSGFLLVCFFLMAATKKLWHIFLPADCCFV